MESCGTGRKFRLTALCMIKLQSQARCSIKWPKTQQHKKAKSGLIDNNQWLNYTLCCSKVFFKNIIVC